MYVNHDSSGIACFGRTWRNATRIFEPVYRARQTQINARGEHAVTVGAARGSRGDGKGKRQKEGLARGENNKAKALSTIVLQRLR